MAVVAKNPFQPTQPRENIFRTTFGLPSRPRRFSSSSSSAASPPTSPSSSLKSSSTTECARNGPHGAHDPEHEAFLFDLYYNEISFGEAPKLTLSTHTDRVACLQRASLQEAFGFSLGAIQGYITIARVVPNTHASRAGLRVGDQLLILNEQPLYGSSPGVVMSAITRMTKLDMVLRPDHRFLRTVELERPNEKIPWGLIVNDGCVYSAVEDSPADWAGVPVGYQILAVNDVDVWSMEDTDVSEILGVKGGLFMKITALPVFAFEELMVSACTGVQHMRDWEKVHTIKH
eukprot:comp18026_c0_seq1/m.18534 comp18026_c0_seq1/g.18534  ORF comp18026_c0_seq1/g.18534 comp18026_c0_seq1/m.18534 type:complete len:289 (-) comp18026_c0_seq1:719-1585(-)